MLLSCSYPCICRGHPWGSQIRRRLRSFRNVEWPTCKGLRGQHLLHQPTPFGGPCSGSWCSGLGHPCNKGKLAVNKQIHKIYLMKKRDFWKTILPGERLNVLGGSKDSSSKRSLLIGDGVEVIKDNLLQVHLDLLHLAKDNATLTFDFLQESKIICVKQNTTTGQHSY